MLLLCQAEALAETMYKCLEKSGAVAYQDRPCDAGSRALTTTEFTPERVPGHHPPPERSPARRSSGQPTSRQRTVAPRHTGGMLHSGTVDSAQCAATKAERDRQTNGQHVKFETLRRWNDRVYEACK